MKTAKLAAIACFGLACLVAGETLADGFKRIESEAQFRKQVVGKKLTLGENHVIIAKNGQVKGKFGGKALKGAWAWREGFWCRTLTTHSKNTDCQLFEISGNQLRGTRSRGTGQSFVYTIN